MLKPTDVLFGFCKYAINLVLILIVACASAQATVTSDSKDSRLSGWPGSLGLPIPHVRANSCAFTVAPSSLSTTPFAQVYVYNIWDAFSVATGITNRTANCRQDVVGNIYVFCGQNTAMEAITSVSMLSSAFSARVVSTWVDTNTQPGNIWGYYCTSTGCYGSKPDGGLDGAADPNDFLINVEVDCIHL